MTNLMKTLTMCLCSLLLGAVATQGQEIPASSQKHPIALVGGTIHTVSGATIERGFILFDKGKITGIGADINVPSDAEVIDIKGKHVYPGFIDARSVLGLIEIGAVRQTVDINETGTINPNIRAEVAINPESESIPVTRANGVTTTITTPAGGIIAGTAAAIYLDGWTWEDMTLKAPIGMAINWPWMNITHAWWERRSDEDQKKERDKAIQDLRNAFKEAREYLKAKKAEEIAGTPYHNVDLRWEAMAPVLDKKIPVLVDADEIQQIQAAVAWAEQENINIIILGGYDSWRAADLLKAKNIPVVAGPIMQLPWRRWEQYDTPQSLPQKLTDAGIKFCIAAGGASNERNLPFQAAMAAGHGLPRDEALKAITLYPAQIFGLDDRIGSLETGKDATLIITDGDPLEISTTIEMEFIQGKNISLSSRHTRLYEKYKNKYQQQKEIIDTNPRKEK